MCGSNGGGRDGSKGQGRGNVVATTAARAGQRGNNSCKEDSKGDTAREGNAVTTMGYCGNNSRKVGSDGGGTKMVLGNERLAS